MNRGSKRISSTPRGRGRSISNVALTVPGPAVMHDDLVGERDGLLEVVGDEDDGRLGPAHRSSSSSYMIARVCTSSAQNGSSMSRIYGSLISVCASATRLRMPPDSWCG